jgi:small subunit ribosomal protein S3Ae
MAKKNIETRKGKTKKKVVSIKKKKKQWVKILASQEFNNLEIGETICEIPQNIVGRVLEVNLMNLVNDSRKQNIRISFKVVEIKGDKAVAKAFKYQLNNSFVKRMARREGSKMDDSFVVESKDKNKFRVKSLVVTKKKIPKSLETAIRNSIRDKIGKDFSKKQDSEIIKGVVEGNIQKELKILTRKAYPASVCEIRVLERL